MPFWSDGARKTRWLAIPNDGAPYSPGERAEFSAAGEWGFPNGTVFVKHFDIPISDADPAAVRRLETRVLVRSADGGVYGASYRWRADQTDAELVLGGLSETLTILTPTGSRPQTWYFPSPADCVFCHNPTAGGVLGVNSRQLNRPVNHDGTMTNQLDWLGSLGALAGYSGHQTVAALSDATDPLAPVETRVRSYLDSNCAYCHRPGGTRAGFDLRFETTNSVDTLFHRPVLHDLGNSDLRVLVPGDLGNSALFVRATSTRPDEGMPPLAKHVVDTNGVRLLGQWIASLAGPAPSLQLNQSSDALELRWPSAAVSYRLETAQRLGNEATWVSEAVAPDQWDEENVLTLQTGAVGRFFRLRLMTP